MILDDANRKIIRYLAPHPLVLASQVQGLVNVPDLAERLAALSAAGLIRSGPQVPRQSGTGPRLPLRSASCQVTARGLRAIGSDLREPEIELRTLWHDIGVAWVHRAAYLGLLGEWDDMLTAPEMRLADQNAGEPVIDPAWSPEVRAKAADSGYGVRLSGEPATPGGELHYPDLLFVGRSGRFAIELELSSPGAASLQRVLAAYGRKASVAAVVYFVMERPLSEMVDATSAKVGLADRVYVQRVSFDPPPR